MDIFLAKLYKELEIVKMAIVLSENPALMEKIKQELDNESTS